MNPKTKSIFRGLIIIVAWFGLLVQLYLTVTTDSGKSVFEKLVNYFSYFTILTNTLVAFGTTMSLLLPRSEIGKFFAQPHTESALTVYIVIVAIIHFLFLREVVELQGWNVLSDFVLHTVVPALYLIYWIFFVPKGELRWQDALQWLVYPFVYFVYVLIRGFIDNFYPYPFANVDQLGYGRALTNGAWIILSFFVLGLILVFIDRFMQKEKVSN